MRSLQSFIAILSCPCSESSARASQGSAQPCPELMRSQVLSSVSSGEFPLSCKPDSRQCLLHTYKTTWCLHAPPHCAPKACAGLVSSVGKGKCVGISWRCVSSAMAGVAPLARSVSPGAHSPSLPPNLLRSALHPKLLSLPTNLPLCPMFTG